MKVQAKTTHNTVTMSVVGYCLRWRTHIRYDTQFTRVYHRIASRRGRKVAVVALARRFLCHS